MSEEFKPFNKIPRLNRACTITEKIDGTNASIRIASELEVDGEFGIGGNHWIALRGGYYVAAGSRTRWIRPGDDNFGFATWVQDHAEELITLGSGHHYGEWWGSGIQRGYGLTERRFSLFNVKRWGTFGTHGADKPQCCDVVPALFEGRFTTAAVELVTSILANQGSKAAPGFMDPEGIVVYHGAANSLFKVTIKGDEEGKHADAHPKKERAPKTPKDPSKGGRRVAQVPFEGADRRKRIVGMSPALGAAYLPHPGPQADFYAAPLEYADPQHSIVNP